MDLFEQWFEEHRGQIREDYFRFLRFATVSADPACKKEILACASWLTEYLRRGGLQAEEIPTSGNPLVYAEEKSAGSSRPTVLIYGHYDVQPVDPLAEWESPPFEPTERHGQIFARGAADDKGQIFFAILATISWKRLQRPWPVNLKFCIEGEEEIGSPALFKALADLKDKMRSDACVIVDFDSLEDGTPAICLGARGLLALEVSLTGSKKDLHSGQMGGIAYNPNRALAEMLSRLWDEQGRVAVPGFYDDVIPFNARDAQPFTYSLTPSILSKEFGIEALGGEKGCSLMEANWVRPTLEINGMWGGYTGAGSKTVIPATAHAKLTCRLVPKQDPKKLGLLIQDFLKTLAPRGIQVQVTLSEGATAFRGSSGARVVRSFARAAEHVTGKSCVYTLSGASIPIGAEIMRVLRSDVAGVGYGKASDQIHAPNEHFDMQRVKKGFLTVAKALEWL